MPQSQVFPAFRIGMSPGGGAAMIAELNHRFANNLTILGAMLTRMVQDPRRGAIDLARRRLAMMANVHRQLSANVLTSNDFADCLGQVCDDLAGLYEVPGLVRVVDVDPGLTLTPACRSCLALIVAELVGNALQHAFARQPSPKIAILLRDDRGETQLVVSDNGCGWADGPGEEARRGLGLKIVQGLASSIGAATAIESHPGAGTSIRVDFLRTLHTSPPA